MNARTEAILWLYKSQRRPRTRGMTDRLKKNGQRIASQRRLKENAKKKNRRRECSESQENREEKKNNIETERKPVTRTSEDKRKQKQRGTLVNQPSLINIFVFKQRLLKRNTEKTKG
ncbi:hypothetical protein Peur_037937 [Populus x canadensis]|jgi:hypothetical protein